MGSTLLYGVNVGHFQSGGVGSLFRMTLDGQYQTYYVMNNANIGSCNCWLTQGSDGKFYGTTQNGGPSATGTAWTWDLGLPKPKPSVKGVRPPSGAVGSTVIIYGNNLLGATAVTFNSTTAQTFRSISANYVSAIVPSGATTGPVTVSTPNGTATSPGSFTVK